MVYNISGVMNVSINAAINNITKTMKTVIIVSLINGAQ